MKLQANILPQESSFASAGLPDEEEGERSECVIKECRETTQSL